MATRFACPHCEHSLQDEGYIPFACPQCGGELSLPGKRGHAGRVFFLFAILLALILLAMWLEWLGGI